MNQKCVCCPEFVMEMGSTSHPLLGDFSESQIQEFDEDIRNRIMEMDGSREALIASKSLKEEGNRFQRAKAHREAITRYEKSLQLVCVAIPSDEDDAILMEELGIALNMNLASCRLKLSVYEAAKNHCDLVLKLDFRNVKAPFKRARALMNLAIVEEAYRDLIITAKFDPNNEEVKNELSEVEALCESTCGKGPMVSDENGVNSLIGPLANSVGVGTFDPLSLGLSSRSDRPPRNNFETGVVDGEVQAMEQDVELVDKKRELVQRSMLLILQTRDLA